MINAEHPSTIQTTVRPRYTRPADGIVWSNTHMPQQWYAGGPSRRKLETIAVNAFRQFGASMYLDPNPRPPAGDLGAFFRGVPGVATSEFYHYFHTDAETPDTVPWTGLEATTRAYAKIIDEVNKLPLSDLQRPEEPAPTLQRPTPRPQRDGQSPRRGAGQASRRALNGRALPMTARRRRPPDRCPRARAAGVRSPSSRRPGLRAL